ncbi:MAG: hypothetical protein ACI4MS_07325 [Candidatus Coproplasma sp.]
MIKFYYSDGQNICSYDGERSAIYPSERIESYKANAESISRKAEWKHSGEGAIFRGDTSYSRESAREINGEVSGVYPVGEDKIIYTYKVCDASGIYVKNLADKKLSESHVINSGNLVFGTGMADGQNDRFAVSVQRNWLNADIAVFDLKTSDYKLLTDGDTFDTDPFISTEEEGIIYFASRGVGRDAHGEFAEFAPSVICRLDTNKMTVEEVASDAKFSYFKPVLHKGKLYAIKAPSKSEKGENGFISFLLFPWRILQAIANLINIFVHAMTGKSASGNGSNPTAGRDYDSRKIEIEGSLIDIEKQKKKNASKKDSDFGIIPDSWQVVEVSSGEVIVKGVCDFDIAEDGTFIATNGRRIFAVNDGKRTKLCNTEMCLHLALNHNFTKQKDDVFGI